MSVIVTSEIISAIFVGVSLISQFSDHDKQKSTRALRLCTILMLLGLCTDAAAYSLNGPQYPQAFLWVINLLAYCVCGIIFLTFIHYCYFYITERTELKRWVLLLPTIVTCFNLLITIILFAAGKMIVFDNGYVVTVGSIPVVSQLLNIIMLIYIPIAAFTKRKAIGVKAVSLLGLYGFVPLIAIVIALATGLDFTISLGAVSVVIVASLLQKDAAQQAITKMNIELKKSNTALCQLTEEQEAQIEEITALNAELEEQQAQLEEASAEQEAHIDEISLLNDRLTGQNEIVSSAGLGTWYIYLKNDAAPRMKPDEKMRALLGIEGMTLSEEQTYSFWHDRILPDALESVNSSVSKIISGVFDENTYQWNHPAKGVIYVRCGGNAKTLPDGTIVLSGYHADVTDIVSREKKQQEALEEAVLEAKKANEAKSRFLSRMSHDIRTPLNGIIGLIELSDRHSDDINAIIAGKEKARVASQHLLSLVNDVLELSKLDDSNVKLAHEPFNILELAGDVLTIAAASAAEYGVSLTHEDCAQEFKYPYVYGSPLHVRQILLNIFSNAAKYNHPGGSIYCRGRFEGKTDTTVTYTVEIEDTGIGMSLEFMEQLFEPFTQEHTDARSTFQGTGLGMAIVKSLVDKMNGTIAVESEEGKGSKFTVTIPFELADEADMPKKADVDDKDITGKKLLLVEDNELNMEIARSILEDFGVIITEAKNGQEAVNIFEQNAPNTFDAILMDVMMPVLDGYGATRKIRELSRDDAKLIPIIAMTANAFEEDKQNALRAGMNGHIAKPIEVQKLIEMLAGILG